MSTNAVRNLPLKAVLIDLSGTLHVENNSLPGAVAALQRLKETNLQVKFVTNTTKESRKLLYRRLTGLGFDIESDEIFSSLSAAHNFVQASKLHPMLILDEAAIEDFADVIPSTDAKLDAVVIGLAPNRFNYEELTKAFRLLSSGARLIAIHEARYFKREDGLALGPGPFVKGLEYAADCRAQVLGKPAADFFLGALGGVEPGAAVMIGDDVRDDVGGAQAVGMRGILVRTGKYREGDEAKIDPPPAFVCADFSEAVDKILEIVSLER